MSTAAMRAAKRIVQSTDFDCQMGWERGIAHIIDEEMACERSIVRNVITALKDALDLVDEMWDNYGSPTDEHVAIVKAALKQATKMRDIALVLYDAVDGLMTEWGGLKDTRLAEQAAKDALRQAEENGL